MQNSGYPEVRVCFGRVVGWDTCVVITSQRLVSAVEVGIGYRGWREWERCRLRCVVLIWTSSYLASVQAGKVSRATGAQMAQRVYTMGVSYHGHLQMTPLF